METGINLQTLPVSDISTADEPVSVNASYGMNLSADAASFAQSLEQAGEIQAVEPASEVAEALMAPLDFINNEARSLADYAQNAIHSGNELTPSEIVTLTTRSQEFMFYSQLTSNVANRTADGLQQLFRQQS